MLTRKNHGRCPLGIGQGGVEKGQDFVYVWRLLNGGACATLPSSSSSSTLSTTNKCPSPPPLLLLLLLPSPKEWPMILTSLPYPTPKGDASGACAADWGRRVSTTTTTTTTTTNTPYPTLSNPTLLYTTLHYPTTTTTCTAAAVKALSRYRKNENFEHLVMVCVEPKFSLFSLMSAVSSKKFHRAYLLIGRCAPWKILIGWSSHSGLIWQY